MNWYGAFIICLAIKSTLAQENEDIETTTITDVSDDVPPSTESQSQLNSELRSDLTTTITDVSDDVPPSSESQIQLNSELRSALLKALTDLENSATNEADSDASTNEDLEGNVLKAQASAVTIFSNENDNLTESTQENNETTEADIEDPSKQKASIIVFQKSQAIQGHSLTFLEKNPLDPVKDAEQIITSASNSFITDANRPNEPRSISENLSTANRESVLQDEQKAFQTNTKTVTFSNFNAISNSESKKPSKTDLVDKFSVGKTIDEPSFLKTGSSINSVKATEDSVDAKNSVSSDVKDFGSVEATTKTNAENLEIATEAAVEVSTEENEAKVEQVQFFSAPLVAAFTVHQDEKGQPKKVEPIYKNGLSSKKEPPTPVQQQPNIPQPSTQNVLQSSTFNSLDLRQKQQILEQELEKLRNQQQNILTRNSFAAVQNFNNLNAKNQGFTQTSFNQAVNQNFNQFDPVFTEPDRSVVTKLATIDPSSLLSQSGGPFLNRFTPNEAISPIVQSEQKPVIQNLKTTGDVTLIPSISFDPLIEAGKLPKNAQVLPTKEPTGFHSFVKLTKPQNQQQQHFVPSGTKPSQNVVQNDFIQNLPRPLNDNNFVGNQPSLSNFVQNRAQPLKNNNFLDNQPPNLNVNQNLAEPNRFLRQETGTAFTNQFSTNQNRFLRQEQGTVNPGFNQNTFSIVAAQQPFPPTHELGYFPNNNNRFLRQNEGALAQPQQTSQNTRFFRNNNLPNQSAFPTQNTRFFRSNLEGTLTSPQNVNIQPSIQPIIPQSLVQSNRLFRSNQEGTLTSPQSLGFGQKFPQNNRILRSNSESTYLVNQLLPVRQTYKYSSSFGFPTIPLN